MPAPESTAEETKHHAESEPASIEARNTPPPPKPEPIALPAGHSLKSAVRTDDTDVAAPAVTQMASFGVPISAGMQLPASSAVPKLTAQVAKTWTGGVLLRRVAPVYPAAARTQGLEGAVELRVLIKKDGSIDNIRVVNGNPILAKAAVDAVKAWRYDPFKADGVPSDREASVTLNFTIPR